jgi:four helix bundle protein
LKNKSVSYRDLEVWKKSIQLAKIVYEITEKFPNKEQYGLTNQLRRSCVSIASNIAEGQVRQSRKEFIYFLNISLGSLAELETQCIIAQTVGILDDEIIKTILKETLEITKMIQGLIKHLKTGN